MRHGVAWPQLCLGTFRSYVITSEFASRECKSAGTREADLVFSSDHILVSTLH